MNRFVEFLRYIKNNTFGWRDAVKLAFMRQSLLEYCVNPKLLRCRLLIRGQGSSDYDVLQEVCVRRKYDIYFANSPRLIVDAGANTGISTAFFATKFPRAKVVAIEPEPRNFELLEENTRALPNVTCYNRALYSSGSKMKVLGSGRSWGFRILPDFEGDTDSITISKILEEFSEQNIDILKLDIEGSEKTLFEENYSDWIERIGVFFIELHDNLEPGASKAFLTAICSIPSFSLSVSGECVVILRNDTLDR